ncbi:MAG: hypothetical protein WAL40_06315, partial [Rhodoplanes sp.]
AALASGDTDSDAPAESGRELVLLRVDHDWGLIYNSATFAMEAGEMRNFITNVVVRMRTVCGSS